MHSDRMTARIANELSLTLLEFHLNILLSEC